MGRCGTLWDAVERHMTFWDKYRKLLTGIGVAALGIVAFHVILVGPATIDREKYREELEADIDDEIKPRRKGVFEVKKATAGFQKANLDLSRRVEALMKKVEIQFHPWVAIPDDHSGRTRPGLWFVKTHAKQRDELSIECQKAVPPALLTDLDLGFTSILSKPLDPKGARENLKRLSIVTRVVKLLAESGVAEIVKITHDEPDRAGPAGYADIMLEYSVQIEVRTRLDPLMRFLHKVRQPGKFFLVVRGLEISGRDPYNTRRTRDADVDERDLFVKITAAGMRFLTKKERKVAQLAVRPLSTGPRKVYKEPLGF